MTLALPAHIRKSPSLGSPNAGRVMSAAAPAS
ncbi:MAG: hypothetical protein JWO90_790 [Solirubrobacterales bacterium]|jgi:hypothetical protein|nr:hypothetical protein [Solirubrobacterales bacterium]